MITSHDFLTNKLNGQRFFNSKELKGSGDVLLRSYLLVPEIWGGKLRWCAT